MKQTITRCDFRDAFRQSGRIDNFSYEGLNALFDWLEQFEADSGVDYELDVIALCCEYNEDSIKDVLKNYDIESLDELKDQTQVIWHDDENVLYQQY